MSTLSSAPDWNPDSLRAGRLYPRTPLLLLFLLSPLTILSPPVHAQIERDAARYVDAISKLNDDHARAPGKGTEAELAKRLPQDARSALARVVQAKASPALAPALQKCAEAALNLDLIADFDAIRTRLEKDFPTEANTVGIAVSRPRFIVRGIGGLSREYITQFADLTDQILVGYDEVFGFAEFSKVPGKKLRIRVHLEPAITKPPHFAPEFPWHSEIDFPVADASGFRSPTQRGHFLFYGLCHELGHVIAMWGDINRMEDQHAWAHYTGVAVTEHVSTKLAGQPILASVQDVRWRSIPLEQKQASGVPPSLADQKGVMSLLLGLHTATGPKSFGVALNSLEQGGKVRRINKVRYYSFADLQKALEAGAKEPAKKKAVTDLFAAAAGKK
jgi:hypothetical protein